MKTTETAGSLSDLESIITLQVAKGMQVNIYFLKTEQKPPKSHTNLNDHKCTNVLFY